MFCASGACLKAQTHMVDHHVLFSYICILKAAKCKFGDAVRSLLSAVQSAWCIFAVQRIVGRESMQKQSKMQSDAVAHTGIFGILRLTC